MDSVGKVRIRSVDLADSFSNSDTNFLTHDEEGLVSVQRGGGKFDFTIAPKPNKDLDESTIIIGKVVSGMETVNKINNVPVSKEDILGTKGSFSNVGKGFDPRAKMASVNRPLQKIKIVLCTVDNQASMSSLMKF